MLHTAGMAWRIDESVVRGEIDNRVEGRVTGRIWFVGLDEPVELELMKKIKSVFDTNNILNPGKIFP